MMNGRNNGKKLMAIRIVAHSFEIVRVLLKRAFGSMQQEEGTVLTSSVTDSHHDRPKPNPDRC